MIITWGQVVHVHILQLVPGKNDFNASDAVITQAFPFQNPELIGQPVNIAGVIQDGIARGGVVGESDFAKLHPWYI